MARTIVLVHGILGFGALPGLSAFINYFNGVAAHLRVRGHVVSAPSVPPLGSVAQRAKLLADAILATSGTPVHVIAHSMGGLDARHAITHLPGVAERVRTLVTIGTPHRGSPVADAIAGATGPLLPHVPPIIAGQLQRGVAALHDLTTVVAHRLDAATPDRAGVRYVEVAGDASRAGNQAILSRLAAAVLRLTGEANDGVVTKSSALRPGREHLDDWPADHLGEVGWSFGWTLLPSAQHLARYEAIVKALGD